MLNRSLAVLFAAAATMGLWLSLGSMQAAYSADDSDATKATAQREKKRSKMPEYPQARRGDTVDDYHGTKVADPYRWLEDPDAPETREWIEAENRVTESYLSQ